MKTLVCIACGTALSKQLNILSGKNPSVEAPEFEDRQPIMPQGNAFKSYEPIEHSFTDEPGLLEFLPQYWLNPDDLTDQVRLTKNHKRLNGCCGLDGTDGPNQLCRCGAEIGTLKTDCWTPRMFIPVPQTTHWIEET
ncbi:MAG: hypothetical protein WBL20_24030 [Sphingobium sp.]|uniref:hypothetical protein n=1 Tax=Sphingobium sp. TaxID=1912891 RepID=UPI002E1F1962